LIDGYYSYGMAPGAADFIDLSAANWIAHPTRIPWTIITLIFGLVGLYIYTRPLNLEVKQAAVVLTGIIMQMMILYLKGFSPQFISWFLPLVPLIMPNGRGLLYSIGLAGLNLLEFPVYFTFLEGELWFLAFVIIARTLLCLIVAFDYWRIYRGQIQTRPVVAQV
jgi:hypothetical protein